MPFALIHALTVPLQRADRVAKSLFDAVCRHPALFLQDVRVGVGRERVGGVPEQFLGVPRGAPRREQGTCGGVAKVVHTDMREPAARLSARPRASAMVYALTGPPSSPGNTRSWSCPAAPSRKRSPATAARCPRSSERSAGAREAVRRDRADFGGPSTYSRPMRASPPHSKHRAVKVDVLPAQRDQLRAAEPKRCRRDHEWPQPLALERGQEPLQLGHGQRPHLVTARRRRRGERSGSGAR